MKWKNSPKAAAFIGMLGALSTILMMVSIPLPFAPGEYAGSDYTLSPV